MSARETYVLTRNRPSPPLNVGVKPHHITAEVVSPSGVITQVIETHNTVLNQFLDWVATSTERTTYVPPHDGGEIWNMSRYCVLGAGMDTDYEEDVGMANEITRDKGDYAYNANYPYVYRLSPGHYQVVRNIEFPANKVGGIIASTIGFSPFGVAGNNLAIKAVLPTSLMVPVGSTLRVKYAYDIIISPLSRPFSTFLTGHGTISGQIFWVGGADQPGRAPYANTGQKVDLLMFAIAVNPVIGSLWRRILGSTEVVSGWSYTQGYHYPDSNSHNGDWRRSSSYRYLPTPADYTPGSFRMQKRLTGDVTAGIWPTITKNITFYSMGPGSAPHGYPSISYPGLVFSFPSHEGFPQRKASIDFGELVFSWGRA